MLQELDKMVEEALACPCVADMREVRLLTHPEPHVALALHHTEWGDNSPCEPCTSITITWVGMVRVGVCSTRTPKP